MATAYFMEAVTRMTDAASDQEHIRMLIDSRPATPDRTAYILGKSEANPLPVMAETGRSLAAAGARVIAVPCNTAQYFQEELEESIGVHVINMVRETVHYLKERGYGRVGVMGTDGTIESGIYQKEIEAAGMEAVVPDAEHQAMDTYLIYDCVKANRPINTEMFLAIGRHLRENGAEAIILGCTELSVIKQQYDIGPGYLDAMDVLARVALEACGAPVKPEFDTLITE